MSEYDYIIGIDAGFASTGFCIVDQNYIKGSDYIRYDLWESKPDKEVSKNDSDIERLKHFTDWFYTRVVGYAGQKVLVVMESFIANKVISWSAIKSIQINACVIAVATMLNFDMDYISPQTVHKFVGGGSKENTVEWANKNGFDPIIKSKARKQHIIDAFAIAETWKHYRGNN